MMPGNLDFVHICSVHKQLFFSISDYFTLVNFDGTKLLKNVNNTIIFFFKVTMSLKINGCLTYKLILV